MMGASSSRRYHLISCAFISDEASLAPLSKVGLETSNLGSLSIFCIALAVPPSLVLTDDPSPLWFLQLPVDPQKVCLPFPMREPELDLPF